MSIYVRGGVGDFLQMIPFIMSHSSQEYCVHTHFSKAKEFFNEFGIENLKVFNFNTIKEHDNQIDEIISVSSPEDREGFGTCPRFFYNTLTFKNESVELAENLINSFKEKKKIIGIHPFGSEFSTNTYSSFSLPNKFIPCSIVRELINEDFNYLIFGSKKEFANYGLEESDNVKFSSFDNIVHSLACVSHCFKFFATDSCFKTQSSMTRIPTFCILGDFEDKIRDKMFIEQYVQDGVMKIFKFKDVHQQRSEIVAFFKEALNQ